MDHLHVVFQRSKRSSHGRRGSAPLPRGATPGWAAHNAGARARAQQHSRPSPHVLAVVRGVYRLFSWHRARSGRVSRAFRPGGGDSRRSRKALRLCCHQGIAARPARPRVHCQEPAASPGCSRHAWASDREWQKHTRQRPRNCARVPPPCHGATMTMTISSKVCRRAPSTHGVDAATRVCVLRAVCARFGRAGGVP